MMQENTAKVFDPESFAQEALDNFHVVLGDYDFSHELELSRVGRLQFLRRRQMLTEWRGLFMALWRVALAKSFPDDADAMFDAFLLSYTRRNPDKVSARTVERAREYWAMLAPQGDADFSAVARHISSFFVADDKDLRSIVLRIGLHIRQLYTYIFECLI